MPCCCHTAGTRRKNFDGSGRVPLCSSFLLHVLVLPGEGYPRMFFSLAPLLPRSDKAGVRGSRFGYERPRRGLDPPCSSVSKSRCGLQQPRAPSRWRCDCDHPRMFLGDCLALVGFRLRGLGRADAGLIEATYVGRRARASAARAGPSMFFGFDVKVRPPATACPLMMAARVQSPSHVLRGELGVGGLQVSGLRVRGCRHGARAGGRGHAQFPGLRQG